MRTIAKTLSLGISVLIVVAGSSAGSLLRAQQETKPVPKDSVRVSVSGCTKGYVFTAGRRSIDEPTRANIPEGMHLRMNGKKDLIKEIRAHEGSMIEITGLMKKGQYLEGVNIGGGVRVMPGTSPSGGSMMSNPTAYQIQIDVEGWRPITGSCRT
jgi:hypothetical protein